MNPEGGPSGITHSVEGIDSRTVTKTIEPTRRTGLSNIPKPIFVIRAVYMDSFCGLPTTIPFHIEPKLASNLAQSLTITPRKEHPTVLKVIDPIIIFDQKVTKPV